MQKRPNDDGDEASAPKRGRYEDAIVASSSSSSSDASNALSTNVTGGVKRTSNLTAPTIQLTGHGGAVYSLSFDATGHHLASGSFDRQIFLWDIYGDNESTNYNVLSGHKNAVLEVKWSVASPQHIVSASADKTVALWDSNKGTLLRKLTEHKGIVNAVALARDDAFLLASGSDDNSAILWDSRSKKPLTTLPHPYQVTAVALNASAEQLYTGGIDNTVRRWDLRKLHKPTLSMELKHHSDTITGLAVSPDGNHVLSNSMDCSLIKWDAKPFVAGKSGASASSGAGSSSSDRVMQRYEGVHHGAEKVLLRCAWSADQEKVACGSADRIVHVWDSDSGKPLYYLPGHKGSVNDVIFHPTEQAVIASCSTDRTIFIGELS